MDRIDELMRKLEEGRQVYRATLNADDPRASGGQFRRFFGAHVHQFQMRPVATEHVVSDWEKEHGVALPSEYREFIQRVGNGGAGPYYGLLPLQEWSHGVFADSDELVRRWVQTPSPLKLHYADATGTAWLVELGGPQWDTRFNDNTWDPLTGTITLCDEGCAMSCMLVVNGPLVGRVFHNEHLTCPDFFSHEGFLAWYGGWLDYVIGGQADAFHRYVSTQSPHHG